MKKLVLIALFPAFLLSSTFAKSHSFPTNQPDMAQPFCVLKTTGESHVSFIPPRPSKENGKLQLHSLFNFTDAPKAKKAVFEITFDESVSEETKTVAKYAAGLWEELLTSDVTINVHLKEESQEEATLASASPSQFLLAEATSFSPKHYDPVAIAERKYQFDLTPGFTDIVITVNSDQEFYYGTDGNCPATQHDLVSILLHELGHGLGFLDSISAEVDAINGNSATYGFGDMGIGLAYDYFLVDGAAKKIIDEENPKEEDSLYTSVTSIGNVYFAGPLTLAITNNTGSKLYTPFRWSDGSSVAHLDEGTYNVGNANSLMTPRANKGEAIHDPGDIGLAMLGDIGWDHVWIQHNKVADSEDVSSILNFEVDVKADSNLTSAPILYFRLKGAEDPTFQQLGMAAGLQAGKFTLPFQLTGVPAKYEYYIGVNASSNRQFTYPSAGANNPLTLNTGPDDVPPVVIHIPDSYHLSNRQIVTLSTAATDNISPSHPYPPNPLHHVSFDVWLDEVLVGSFAAELNDQGKWTSSFGMPDMTGKTAIQYRINAWDASAQQNGAIYPQEGFYTLPIEQIYTPTTTFVSDLEAGAIDFILDGFEVKTLEGFASASLGTIHPYKNNGERIDYYAYLRQPLVVQSGMKITFDEIVLVEMGEDGTVFGDDEFWDYVTVEISKDRGRTWAPLTDGWDSSADSAWSTAFTSGIPEDSNDSTALGTPDMYRDRVILFDDSEAVAPGDEIMLRFHLFSDPYSVGWGWEIDNIVIGF